MKKQMILTAVIFASVFAHANPTGDAASDRTMFRLDAARDTARMEFIRDGERHAVKVSFLKYYSAADGAIGYGIALYNGGDREAPGMGIAVKPNTKYNWSFELKGEAKRVFVAAYEMSTKDFWSPRNRLKLTGRTPVPVTGEWTKCQGSFTTGEKPLRATLQINLYGSEKYKDLPEKPGDYFMISNVKIEEAK